MGGRGRSRTQRKHFHQSRENVWKRSKSDESALATPDNTKRNTHWEPFMTQNPGFDEYYKEQEIVSAEEWDTFIQYIRKPLPAAFRINSSGQFFLDIRTQLENDFMKSLHTEDSDGSDEVVALKPLRWYPDNLAWQSNFSRNQLRKNETLTRFHEFLKLENEIGNITRQEAVSMVPPLFLDVLPDHFVLDMCAAPGSKTFQLLEMIHKLTDPGKLPSGMVIANDLDVQRCNLLIHQTKRMCTANLIVTNHEAQHFPSCRLKKNYSFDSEVGTDNETGTNQLQFDRVLCDVPCSGDGTLRKAPDIWRKWNTGMGNGLHGLQIQIAMRGLALLKIGGRMVYSTCSMNPVENEAVVSEVLRRCEGSIELVDVSTELPELLRRPGLKKWKVRDKGLWLASFKDVPISRRSVTTPSMFPSGTTLAEKSEGDPEVACEQLHEKDNENSESTVKSMDDYVVPTDISGPEESSFLPLERCMRIVPHDQNSGAFFIAVFHKLSSLPANQKKSDTGNSAPGGLMNRVNNGGDANVTRGENIQISATIFDADIVDDGMEPPTLDIDDNKIYVEDVKRETKSSPNTENIQISATIFDADIVDDGMVEHPTLDIADNKLYVEDEKGETKSSPDTETSVKITATKRKLQVQGRWRGVDPVIFYRDDATVSSIKKFYGIKESFPFEGHLITRNNESKHMKRIYYISESVKKVLELNFLAGQQLKIASVGIKMFERQTSKEGSAAPCLFRISSEGLPLILPHITKQILYVSAVDFKHLLQYKSIKFSEFVDPEFGEMASKLMLGCCVLILKKDGKFTTNLPQADEALVAIGCWKGRTSVSIMVTAIDCQELLGRISILFSTQEPKQPEVHVVRDANSSLECIMGD